MAVALMESVGAIKLASALETEILSSVRRFPSVGNLTGLKAWVYVRGWPVRFPG